MLQVLLDNLPHGSGIDDRWNYDISSTSIRLYNGFHCMDENGFYDDWANFVLIVPKNALLRGEYVVVSNSFKLQFLGQRSQYLATRYDLRNYLEDIFAEFFRGL